MPSAGARPSPIVPTAPMSQPDWTNAMRRVLLPPALMLLVAAAPPSRPMAAAKLPTVPVYREFGRWLVACDNTRVCVARGFDETTRAELDVTRAAGEAPATLTFSAEDPIVGGGMRMDGKPFVLRTPAWSMKGGALSTSDPDAVAAFVAAAGQGHALTLDAGTSGIVKTIDDTPRTVPLDGFNAALRLVDAVQGRPGTSTALVAARGGAIPPSALPVPTAPRWVTPSALTHDEAGRLLEQAKHLISPNFNPCEVTDPPEIYALDAAHALAIRPCYLAAYQGSSVVAILSRTGGRSAPVTLALPGLTSDASDGPDMVDPSFNPASGVLSSTSKGRGLADCGSDENWVWSNGAFRIKAFNYQGMCGGTEAGDWPPLYRTR